MCACLRIEVFDIEITKTFALQHMLLLIASKIQLQKNVEFFTAHTLILDWLEFFR